ncbi:MAG: [FeFe] hydrogenase H-cluster maturation GTPase HydF [Gallicola sp.]|nr:[FeFe] hydrogenase H-cluster maturation GTPase HydF [Gallicola sp.]
MIKTPRALRTHIGIFGKTNAGKSTLLNKITDQRVSITSSIPGTTTDNVYKTMELHNIGPVVFIDTPGFGDDTALGEERLKNTRRAIEESDIGIFIYSGDQKADKEILKDLWEKEIPLIYMARQDKKESFRSLENYDCIFFDIEEDTFLETLFQKLSLERQREDPTITGSLVKPGDLVLLVMPQDIQAPKGRLILPQVQTIREVLDKNAVVLSSTVDKFVDSLEYLSKKPNLIITDSQCFAYVYDHKPEEVPLTSFSVLFSKYKGDIEYFTEAVKVLEDFPNHGKILIAEACTHPPLEEDIGRVKIPALLRKKIRKDLEIDFIRGSDFFPEGYDLVIHCGACMFNRRHLVNRVEYCRQRGIPMTNYGIVIAFLNGILEKIVY